MEEIVVTRLWMAGVVAMMLVFGIIAMFGHFGRKTGGDAAGSGQEQKDGASED
ncbi:MAG: hypothetical protein ACR2Q3_07840 [Woeseiaceae bacterium]